MTAPGNGLLFLVLTLCVVVSSGYAVGRIHQWHRHGLERDEAYRIGYDKASHSIVGMVTGQQFAGFEPDIAAGVLPPPARPAPAAGPVPGRRTVVNQRQAYAAQRVAPERARTAPRP
jgi:hypothetical protein